MCRQVVVDTRNEQSTDTEGCRKYVPATSAIYETELDLNQGGRRSNGTRFVHTQSEVLARYYINYTISTMRQTTSAAVAVYPICVKCSPPATCETRKSELALLSFGYM